MRGAQSTKLVSNFVFKIFYNLFKKKNIIFVVNNFTDLCIIVTSCIILYHLDDTFEIYNCKLILVPRYNYRVVCQFPFHKFLVFFLRITGIILTELIEKFK